MLENQARYVIIGAEGSSEHGWDQRSLIEKIVRDSRGWIDVIVMLMNKKMVENVERSRKEMQEGELYDWDEFKKIVDEE